MDLKQLKRIYIFRLKDGEFSALKRMCEELAIPDNGVFAYAKSFHPIWGIGPMGLLYLSPSAAQKGIDFNSLFQLEGFLLSLTSRTC